MTEHRFTLFGKPMAPWRSTRLKALEDAAAAGEATWDEARGRYFTNPGADIQWREVRS